MVEVSCRRWENVNDRLNFENANRMLEKNFVPNFLTVALYFLPCFVWQIKLKSEENDFKFLNELSVQYGGRISKLIKTAFSGWKNLFSANLLMTSKVVLKLRKETKNNTYRNVTHRSVRLANIFARLKHDYIYFGCEQTTQCHGCGDVYAHAHARYLNLKRPRKIWEKNIKLNVR